MALKKEKFNFNKAYTELQHIVTWFEKENLDLEEGVRKFEEGSKLVKELKEYLQTIENNIKDLKKDI